MAGSGGGGSKKIPWKLIMWLALYVFIAASVPQFRPANIAHSLQVFVTTVQQGLHNGGG
jgi:hypothetical protein